MNSRDNNFNFIRLVLATAVLFTHSYVFVFGSSASDPVSRLTANKLEFARLAVNAFFAISGFLITQSWLSSPSPGQFFRKRVQRIYPGFLVAGAFTGFILHPLVAGWTDFYTKVDLRRLGLGLFCLQYWAPRTALPHLGIATSFNGAIWTIPMEFLCYLGVLALGWSQLLRKRPVVLVLFGASVIAYCLQASGRWSPDSLYNSYVMPYPQWLPRCSMFFLSGSVAYSYREYLISKGPWLMVAVIACLLSCFVPNLAEVVHAIAGTYLLLLGAFAPIKALDWFKNASDISYGTYLYGYPFQFALAFWQPSLPFLGHLALSIGLSLSFGWLSWNLVEKWFLGKKTHGKTAD